MKNDSMDKLYALQSNIYNHRPGRNKISLKPYKSYRVFTFSVAFWVLSALLSQPLNWFPTQLYFTNPGILNDTPSLWLKANAGITQNSGGVSYWRDQSGNGNHAYQTNQEYRPQWKADYLNFNPVLELEGDNDFMYGWSGFSTQTFFIVTYNDEQITPSDAGQAILNYGANGNNYLGLGNMTSHLNNEFISFGIIQDSVYRSGLVANGYISAGAHMYGSWRSTTSTGPRQHIEVNGQDVVNTEYKASNYSFVNNEEYVIGGKMTSNRTVRNLFNGKIAEVIVFDSQLPKLDRAKVQSYLAIKYGLTLDQDHEDFVMRAYYNSNGGKVWDPLRNNGFGNDIAGVGWDDESSLRQNRSKSTNEGAIVTIGDAQDLTNGEYLIWSNDGASLDFSDADAPGGYLVLSRQWKVQETGDLGAVQVAGMGSHVIVDREGNGFADNNPLPLGTPVNLNDGDLFTFALIAPEVCGAPGGINNGLATWLRADVGVATSENGRVNLWEDQSGNGHFAFQPTTNLQPNLAENSINFNPALEFNDAAGTFMQSLSGGFHTNDYFLVFVPNDYITAGGGGNILLGTDPDVKRVEFGYKGYTQALQNELFFHFVGYGYTYGSGYTSPTRIIDPFLPYITNVKDNSNLNGTDIYFNGVRISDESVGTYTGVSDAPFAIGADFNGRRAHPGKIAEVIVYDRRTSNGERRRIQSYLALKYGITLDQSAAALNDRHYYTSGGVRVWNAQVNAAYAQDIAGIGRDEASCFLQPQSKSQNRSGILRVASAGELEDGSFMVWGNNGAALNAFSDTGMPNGYLGLDRIWKVQTTGAIGAVDIAFPSGALGKSNGSNYFLIVDTDNNGLFSDESPRSFTAEDGEFILKNVNLSNGNRFTIGVNCMTTDIPDAPIREEYYLPVPEDQLLTALQTIYPSATDCSGNTNPSRLPKAPVFNYTSITTQGQGTIIVYDHWEDGFESDLENPTQASTEIWGDGNAANGYPPGIPCDVILADAIVLEEMMDPAERGNTIRYDGGDHLGASGPIAITKANWADGSRTLFAGAVEVIATEFWSKEYLVPFGQNVATGTNSFEYVGALIMAGEDNTQLSIDTDGNGSPDQNTVLNRGESYQVNGGLFTGAAINASAPVQVHISTGDICDNFESRWFTLPGSDLTCDAYYSAVTDVAAMYYFYNPNETAITLKHWTGVGVQSDIFVPAKGFVTEVFETPDKAGHHFYSRNGESFYAAFLYSMEDFTGRGAAFDWGAMLICEDLLPRSLQIGWAYGQDPTLPQFENGSPIWLTAAYPRGSFSSGPIQVCIDFNGDGLGPFSDGNGRNYDLSLSLDEYEAVRVFDPDGDQTGTIISVCDGSDAILSVHWGGDQDASSADEPGLDLGTGIPFGLPYYVDKLVSGIDGDDIYQAGEVIEYSVEILPLGQNILSGPFQLIDELPAELEYIETSMEVIDPDGTISAIMDDAIGTAFPLDGEGLEVGQGTLIHPGEKIQIRFRAKIRADVSGKLTNTAVIRKGIYEREDDVSIEVEGVAEKFDLALLKRINTSLTPGPFTAGSPVSFELEVFNQGEQPAYQVEITDYLPTGLQLNDGEWTLTDGKATRVIPGPIPVNDSEKISIDFIVEEGYVGIVDNYAEISKADNDTDTENNDPLDEDSIYDSDPSNDAGGRPDSPSDDALNGNGQGQVGAPDAATDADDHDVSRVMVDGIFDLALIKQLNEEATSGDLGPGMSVEFIITIINQGNVDAYNVEVTDYIPSGLNLNDVDWATEGQLATQTIPGPISANGGRAELSIHFTIDPSFLGGTLLNKAEISAADDDQIVNNTAPTDIDSPYDQNPDNDAGGQPNSLADDAVDGNGQGVPNDGNPATDEDDADGATIFFCTTLDAGSDGREEICNGCGTGPVLVDLFGALNGTPDPDGSWEDLSGSDLDIRNPQQVDFASAEVGDYVFRYSVGDGGECGSASALVTVEVRSFAAMACNDLIILSFGNNCSIRVGPDLVLEGTQKCPAQYEVRLYDSAGNFLGDMVTAQQAGQTIYAEVHNLTCGTYCSGQLRIEDTVAPQIICPGSTVDLICSDADSIFNNPASLDITGRPQLSDNCSEEFQLDFTDVLTNEGDCGNILITRSFVVTDASGNSATCDQQITIRKPGFSDLKLPETSISLNCDEAFALDEMGHPHPSVTGYPAIETYFGSFPLDQVYCNMGASYQDSEPIQQCAGNYTLIRTWTLVDWCAEENPIQDFTQLVSVTDETPPTVSCQLTSDGQVDTLFFSTSPFGCVASFEVPLPEISDNCSDWTVAIEVVTDVEVPVFDRFGQQIGTEIETQVIASIPAGTFPSVSDISPGCHRFRYTVEDACGNTTIEECPFCVVDDVEPIAVCDQSLSVNLGGSGYGRLYATDMDEGSWDNCGLDKIEIRRKITRDANCNAVPVSYSDWGEYVEVSCCDIGLAIEVELGIIDKAGNRNSCQGILVVEDNVQPFCTAPADRTIGCNELPTGFDANDVMDLQALFGEASGIDNCGATTWEELIPDVDLDDCKSGTIIRRFQVYDGQGNTSSNTCRQVVTIESYFEYKIKFPADVISSCGASEIPGVEWEELGCDNLSISVFDETYTDVPGLCSRTLRRYRIINWCEYDTESDPVVIGRDEDCDGVGGDEAVWVIRRNNQSFLDRDDDELNAIPAAGERTECSPNNPEGYWGTTNANGYWQYTQHIDVVDAVPASITFQTPDPFCSLETNCTGVVTIPFELSEDCEEIGFILHFDENDDGSNDLQLDVSEVLRGSFPNYLITDDFPMGEHALLVQIEDICGSSTTTRIPFTVVDCLAPTPNCIQNQTFDLQPVTDGSDVDGDGDTDFGFFEVDVSMLVDGAVEDCSGSVQFSIGRVGEDPDPEQTELIITCDDPDTLQVRIYAWDAANNPYAAQPDGSVGGPNFGFCQTAIFIRDEAFNACDQGSIFSGRISGLIMTEMDDAVENVTVNLSGPENQDRSTLLDGSYYFENLEEGFDYTITPNLNLNHRNGVTTFDLTLVEKHLLGTKRLDSPYKLIAADVNRSGTITVYDIVKMRQLILGQTDAFSNNTSWRFIKEDHVFLDDENPFAGWIPELITINDLFGQFNDGDFIGVKVGDVNNTAIANSGMGAPPRSFPDTLQFLMDDVVLRAGEQTIIPVYLKDLDLVEGFQYTLELNSDQVEFLGVEPGIVREDHIGLRYLNEGLLTFSWNRGLMAVEAGDNLNRMFSLSVYAHQETPLKEVVKVNSRVTLVEAFNTQDEWMEVDLAFVNGRHLEDAFHLKDVFHLEQNRPNPFTDQTNIDFYIPKSGRIRLLIQDIQGRTVWDQEAWMERGKHRVILDKVQLRSSGLLYYSLIADGFKETKKMLLIR